LSFSKKAHKDDTFSEDNDMKAIILAAGYGNRMRPLTDNKHKTLLTIAGETIIGRILDGLCDNGITDFVIVTGYRHEELREYCDNHYPSCSIQYVHNERFRETNNIFSLALAFEQIVIDTDIILIESDLIYEPAVIKRLLSSPYANVALVDHWASGMDGTVVKVENNVVTSVIPPHLQDAKFDFSDKFKTLNIYKFSMDFCNCVFKKLLTYYAKTINDNCYYELMLGILIYMQQETMYAEILEGEKWAEVDDPNDLHVAEFAFDLKRRAAILEEGFGGYWNYDILDFCFIRNMYFPNAAIISEMRNNLPDLLYNYGSRQDLLDQKLAWLLLCDKESLHALNGASQIYPILRQRFGGKRALIPSPTFGEYTRIFPEAATYSDSIGMDMDEVLKKSAACDVVVFVNPNNPTGSLIDSGKIMEFAARHPQKTVLVDESFIEFAGCPSVLSLLETEHLENVIVIKSLSKSLGMPGLRLGYVYSRNRDFNGFVLDNLPIWGLNSMAEFAMEVLLKHRKSLAKSMTDTVRDREDFRKALAGVPCVSEVFPSAANFVLVALRERGSAARIAEALLSKYAIYVKDISHKFPDGRSYLRLAVRLPAENALLVKCLKEIG
jgi:histidinol-phosphate/aromatic aminotransferase/cobyric acid decarboxylase-like protein/choline kinase